MIIDAVKNKKKEKEEEVSKTCKERLLLVSIDAHWCYEEEDGEEDISYICEVSTDAIIAQALSLQNYGLLCFSLH